MTDHRDVLAPAVSDAELAADRWTVLREPSRGEVAGQRFLGLGAPALALLLVADQIVSPAMARTPVTLWLGCALLAVACPWVWRAARYPQVDAGEARRLTTGFGSRDRRRIRACLLRGERPRGHDRPAAAAYAARAQVASSSAAAGVGGIAVVVLAGSGRAEAESVLVVLAWATTLILAAYVVLLVVSARRLRDAAASVGVVARVAPRATR